jgi:hypothetical protein
VNSRDTVYGACTTGSKLGIGKCTVRKPPSPSSIMLPVASASESMELRAIWGARAAARGCGRG